MGKVIEHNVESGEIIEREQTAAEIIQAERDANEAIRTNALRAEILAKRAALLEKLGITEEEAKLLLK